MSRLESNLVGIKPDAVRAWLTLGDALQRLEESGRKPVCQSSADDWGSEAKPEVRRAAQEACGWCPIANACHAFATSNDERSGVWAGIDRTPSRRKKETPE